MNISKISAVYYSATGNTEKTVTHVTKLLAGLLHLPYSFISYTLPAERKNIHAFSSDEPVIFATPVYAGRLPNKLLPYIQSGFIGHNTPVLPIVVFGNRNYDNALAELCGELRHQGFLPFAAAAVASCHVFSDRIGTGRPDKKDLLQLDDFTKAVALLLKQSETLSSVSVPGKWPDAPYYRPLGTDGEPANFLKAVPKTEENLCDHCSICAGVCPMGSIDPGNTSLITGICIKCQACIKACPTHAKYFDDPAFLSHVKMLEENFTKRANPAFFLPQ